MLCVFTLRRLQLFISLFKYLTKIETKICYENVKSYSPTFNLIQVTLSKDLFNKFVNKSNKKKYISFHNFVLIHYSSNVSTRVF